MADAKITAEEYDRWIPASEALKTVSDAIHNWDQAQNAIVRRLASGLVRSCARHGQTEKNGTLGDLVEWVSIPPSLWKRIADGNSVPYLSMWTTNDLALELPREHHSMALLWNHYYGIRFDLAAIADMLPKKPSIAPQPLAEASSPPIPASSEPPVSQAHLEQWAALFNATYANASEATALESARGMFPGKAVSRERVRSVIRRRLPGRPKSAN